MTWLFFLYVATSHLPACYVFWILRGLRRRNPKGLWVISQTFVVVTVAMHTKPDLQLQNKKLTWRHSPSHMFIISYRSSEDITPPATHPSKIFFIFHFVAFLVWTKVPALIVLVHHWSVVCWNLCSFKPRSSCVSWSDHKWTALSTCVKAQLTSCKST